MTHLSLPIACIPPPPLRLNPYPREWTITSWFPINIAMLPNLTHNSSDYMSGPTVPTDVTLPFCPRPYRSSTPPICSRRSPVFPKFSVLFRLLFPSSGLFPLLTTFLSLPSATTLLQCSPSRHYPIPFFRSLHSPLIPTHAPPILPPSTSRTSCVHCLAFHMLD